jgi:hypothetical protein
MSGSLDDTLRTRETVGGGRSLLKAKECVQPSIASYVLDKVVPRRVKRWHCVQPNML